MTLASPAPDRSRLTASIRGFVGINADYYARAFVRIQSSTGIAFTFNRAAAAFGPLWGAARNLWGFFWVFAILELIALVQIGRGLWGDLGAAEAARAQRLTAKAQAMLERAGEAAAAGQEKADALRVIAENMTQAARLAQAAADAEASGATALLLLGLVALATVKAVEGVYANIAYERRYSHWRVNPAIGKGFS